MEIYAGIQALEPFEDQFKDIDVTTTHLVHTTEEKKRIEIVFDAKHVTRDERDEGGKIA